MLQRTTYPHMYPGAESAVAARLLTVLAASSRGVTVATEDGQQARLHWGELIEAANQDDTDLGLVYLGIWKQGRKFLQSLPLDQQDIRVIVTDQSTSAMWYVWVLDASGTYRRDLMRADEGCGQPRKWLAEKEADDIRARLATRGR